MPFPLHDQNLFQMSQVDQRANRYRLKDPVFAAFDHAYLADRYPFEEYTADTGGNHQITDLDVLLAGGELHRAESFTLAFDHAPRP